MDEFGERLTSGTCEMARPYHHKRRPHQASLTKMSKARRKTRLLQRRGPGRKGTKGNPINKRKGPKVIPKEELSRVFYMQYRVDKITPTRKVEKAVNEGIGGLVVQQDNEMGGDSHPIAI